jgi:hypothetical protein
MMIKRIFALLLCAMLLGLSACGGPAAETTPPALPDSQPYETGKMKNVDVLLDSFNTSVQAELSNQRYTVGKPVIYTTMSLDLAGVRQFYDDKLLKSGWSNVPSQLPETPKRMLLSYQKSNALFVVTAIDASAYLGQGVVVYTIKATK